MSTMGFLRRPWSIFAPLNINRRGLSFLGTMGFLTGFFGARLFAVQNPNVVLAQGGIHFHHFWYGLGMVVVAGWLGIAQLDPGLRRLYAVVFGLGGGLIGDEAGLLLTLGDYHSDLTYFAVVAIVAVAGLLLLFTVYHKDIEHDV